MIGLLQRVSQARVEISHEIIASINSGLLVLIGIEKADSKEKADRLLERLLNYRVFPDQDGKMNLSLRDTKGGLLLVPQFTLPAETKKGNRPGFSTCAPPEQGKDLFHYFLEAAQSAHKDVAVGRFGADMQVSLTNDGPVTFWLQV
jgi:D-tyrosyl-tRNA(Tyr) deacylase